MAETARAQVRKNLPFLMHLASLSKNKTRTGGGVYQIVLIGTERYYIGSGKSVGCRLVKHAKKLVKGKHENLKLQRAWDQYGADRFQDSHRRKCMSRVRRVGSRRLVTSPHRP
jgi:hypothetical protein